MAKAPIEAVTRGGTAIANTIRGGAFDDVLSGLGGNDSLFGAGVSLAGGSSMMLAAAAMALLNWGRGKLGASSPSGAAGPLAAIAFLAGLHAGIPSAGTWLQPASWPGRIPPITLLSFLVGSAALTVFWARIRNSPS